MFLIVILAGIIPMVLYTAFLYWMDRHEREPIVLVVSVFLWGFIPAAILSIISQLLFSFPFLIVDPSGASADLFGIVIAAPVTEEIFKGLAVALIYLLVSHEFDSVFDGILYGSIVGFGFAAIENILYFAGAGADLGILIFMRAFLFGLNHAFYTSLIGIGFGVARHAAVPAVRWLAPVLGLLGAIATHMFHNGSLVLISGGSPVLFLITIIGDYIGIFGVFLVIVFALHRERRWIEHNLREEVPNTLSQQVYDVIAKPIPRFMARLSGLQGGPAGWWHTGRYFDALVDLAYKKQLYARRGDSAITTDQIEVLRQRAHERYLRVQAYLSG